MEAVKNDENKNIASNGDIIIVDNEERDEYTKVYQDGSKENVSEMLTKTKTFGNYEISNIQFVRQNEQSMLLASCKNIGTTAIDMKLITVRLLNDVGYEIGKVDGIISPLEPGETTQLNISFGKEYLNVYNFEIKEK